MSEKLKEILRHFSFAVWLLIVIFVGWTVIGRDLPHPDKVGPYLLLAASLFSSYKVFRIRKNKNIKIYLFIALFSIFSFLEEVGYGMEQGLVDPLLIPGVERRFTDLHDLFAKIILPDYLESNLWNGDLFQQYIKVEFYLLLTAIITFFAQKYLLANKNNLSLGPFIFTHIFALLAISAVAIFASSRQSFSENILGNSVIWLAFAIFIVSLALMYFVLLRPFKIQNNEAEGSQKKNPGAGKSIAIFLFVVIVVNSVFQFVIPITALFNYSKIAQSYPPIFALITGHSLILLVGLNTLGLSQFPRRQIAQFPQGAIDFLFNYPSYIFISIAVLELFVAQLIDSRLISLHDYFSFPELWLRGVNRWTEETFEAIAGIHLLLAAFFIPNARGIDATENNRDSN